MSSRFSAWSSTTSTHAISASGERDGERAALTLRALHEYPAAKEFCQLLADIQAEPGSLISPGPRLSDLFEGSEQPVRFRLGITHARLVDTRVQRAPVLGVPQCTVVAAAVRELAGVVVWAQTSAGV